MDATVGSGDLTRNRVIYPILLTVPAADDDVPGLAPDAAEGQALGGGGRRSSNEQHSLSFQLFSIPGNCERTLGTFNSKSTKSGAQV